MGSNTAIEWADHTINFWWGCDKVHEGCANCYAEAWSKRYGLKLWGPGSVRKRIKGAIPLAKKLNEKARRDGVRYRVFSNSMADMFEQHSGPVIEGKDADGTPLRLWKFEGGYKAVRARANVGGLDPVTLDDLRREAFQTIDACPNLDWLVLTKRPENVRGLWPDGIAPHKPEKKQPLVCVLCGRPWRQFSNRCECGGMCSWGYAKDAPMLSWTNGVPNSPRFRDNVALGTSISLQPHADKQISELLNCRDLCPVLFVSAEPLLGRISLAEFLVSKTGYFANVDSLECGGKTYHKKPGIDWLIIGCESRGDKVGRLGEFKSEDEWIEGAESLVEQCHEAGVSVFVKQIPVRGMVEHDAEKFPEALRCREFPKVPAHA